MDFYAELLNIVGKDRVLREEPLRLHTTLRIGGPAGFLVKPESEEELSALLQCCNKHEVPRFILGNGSNLLVSDEGIKRPVICLGHNYSNISVFDKSFLYLSISPSSFENLTLLLYHN